MNSRSSLLIPPYKGKLVDLVVEGKEQEELIAQAHQMPSYRLSFRSLCDLELLATGAFSPLRRIYLKDVKEIIRKSNEKRGG
ncbi:MAG: hypothetical protein JSW40_08990 [Candidatus Omnitrophota bacterium]|nr:MAG: hypothetical protein JSW40_08990 [Candidatus Omnitrophota bacterium]